MKRIFFISLLIIFSSKILIAQKEKQTFPIILQASAPVYPTLAIHLRIEQKIVAQVQIDRSGQILSVNFDRGDKNFQAAIKDALKQWKFNISSKKSRLFNINFAFILLPSDSKSYGSSVFKLPNVIEVYARQIEVANSIDH